MTDDLMLGYLKGIERRIGVLKFVLLLERRQFSGWFFLVLLL
jgi:hypothetical protein